MQSSGMDQNLLCDPTGIRLGWGSPLDTIGRGAGLAATAFGFANAVVPKAFSTAAQASALRKSRAPFDLGGGKAAAGPSLPSSAFQSLTHKLQFNWGLLRSGLELRLFCHISDPYL